MMRFEELKPETDGPEAGAIAPRAGSRAGMLVRNNLVALGTAAVLTVYAAGYDRTRAAAQRFAADDAAERRPPPPSARLGSELISPAAPRAGAPRSPADTRAPHGTAGATRPEQPSAPAATAAQGAKPPAPAEVVADTVNAGATPRDSSPSRPAEKPAAPVALPAVDSTAIRAAAQAAADSAEAEKQRALLKDGEYYGWGTSRHGDIQAGVEIKGGRITAAWVNQCLTRYSCSWISALPGQVIARQSPEVDFVSGATQSTNAFYYAVVQALSRAK
jgi:uncharacterized protein with FMN-binding domain